MMVVGFNRQRLRWREIMGVYAHVVLRQRGNPMIIVKEYHIDYSASMNAYYVWADEPLLCSLCGCAKIIKKGWRRRGSIDHHEKSKTLMVRRVKCKDCGKTHHVLPDTIVPYKHYNAEAIEKIIRGRAGETFCNESEINRIKSWWVRMRLYIAEKAEVVIKTADDIQITPDTKLAVIVRTLANAHLWPSTRVALGVA
jgi:hypothetical protein